MKNVFELVAQYSQLQQPVGVLIALIGAVLAALACFLGYRFQKVWTALLGFGIGALVGKWLAGRFVENSIIEMLIAIVCGFFIAVLACAIHMFGAVLLSFFFGYGIAAGLLSLFMQAGKVTMIISLIVGFVSAVLCVIFTKVTMIIISALFGGLKMADFVLLIVGIDKVVFLLGGALILALIGILLQWLTTRHYTLDRGGDRVNEY